MHSFPKSLKQIKHLKSLLGSLKCFPTFEASLPKAVARIMIFQEIYFLSHEGKQNTTNESDA